MKVTTTHVSIEGALLHVEGTRGENIVILEHATTTHKGFDLTILAQKKMGDTTYYRTKVWLGPEALKRAVVASEHDVEVSDEPFSDGHQDDAISLGSNDSELEVTLG